MSKRDIKVSGLATRIPAYQMDINQFGLSDTGDIYFCFEVETITGIYVKNFLSLQQGVVWGQTFNWPVIVMPPGSKFEVTV